MVMGMDTGTVMGRMNARLKRLLTAGSVFVGLLAGLEPAHVLAQQQQPMTGRPAGQLEGGAATRNRSGPATHRSTAAHAPAGVVEQSELV